MLIKTEYLEFGTMTALWLRHSGLTSLYQILYNTMNNHGSMKVYEKIRNFYEFYKALPAGKIRGVRLKCLNSQFEKQNCLYLKATNVNLNFLWKGVPFQTPLRGHFFFYLTIIPYNNPLSDHSIAIGTFNINVSMLTLMFCLWFDYWGKLFSISSCPAILTD